MKPESINIRSLPEKPLKPTAVLPTQTWEQLDAALYPLCWFKDSVTCGHRFKVKLPNVQAALDLMQRYPKEAYALGRTRNGLLTIYVAHE